VAAALAGVGTDFLLSLSVPRRRTLFQALAIIAILVSCAWSSARHVIGYYDPWNLPAWRAGREIDRIAPPEALVIVPGEGEPTTLYYARRKGWHFLGGGTVGSYPASSAEAIRDVENLKERGAKYFVLTKYTMWFLRGFETERHGRVDYSGLGNYLDARYRRIVDDDYLIYDLNERKAAP
jgi:hypothetical protein